MIENKFMDHLEAIVKIDQIIGDDFCDDISNHIDKINLSNMGMISGVDKKGRNVLGYTLQKKDKILFKKIGKKIEDLYLYYKIKFLKTVNNQKINQIDLLKYSVGGKYGAHIDSVTDVTRSISVILNLNNQYKGGSLIFMNPMNINEKIKEIQLKKGSIVFFPSNFLYPHQISPITEGTRYSIVAWLQ
tara:strand:- start:3857 stop:4420 length:564 start_codon:yes stop_codon:yes gene_type:complete